MTDLARPERPSTPGAARAAGLLSLVCGSVTSAAATGLIDPGPRPMSAPPEIVLCAGVAFVLAGILLLTQAYLPPASGRVLGATLVTALTLIPTWVAFGAGSRRFAGSGNVLALLFGLDAGRLGRVAFGVAAVAMWAYTVFAWRVATAGFAPLVRLGTRAALLALLGWGIWGRTLEPRARPGESDADRLAGYIDRRHQRQPDASDDGPPRAVVPVEDAWIRAARERLAAARPVPADAAILVVPRSVEPPTIDGRMDPSEWLGSLRIPLDSEDRGASVFVLASGPDLFIAGDAPLDLTEKGYDQLRFYFHLDLTPRFEDERVFVDGRGRNVVLRGVRVGDRLDRRSERNVLAKVRAAAGLRGHRQFELAMDAREAGLASPAPFPAFFEIEGDPDLDESGRFKDRTIEGRAGSRAAPLWLRIAS